jgi:hypothetical protein
MTDHPPSGDPTPETPAGVDAIHVFLAFLPPVTLITGLLFYFGWVRVDEQARALHQRDVVFSYSTADYVLRSVDSLFFPLLLLAATAIAMLIVHQQVQRSLADGTAKWAGVAGWIVAGVGVAMLAFGIAYAAGLFNRTIRPQAVFPDVAGPLAIGLGAILLAYGGWLRAQTRPQSAHSTPWWQRVAAAGAIGAIIALTLFWAVGNYARVRGDELAAYVQDTYRTFPAITVFASKDLSLQDDARGSANTGPDVQYPYRYECLRLLDHVGGIWYLLPEDWDINHKLIMLADDTGLRVETSFQEPDDTCPGFD